MKKIVDIINIRINGRRGERQRETKGKKTKMDIEKRTRYRFEEDAKKESYKARI